MKTPPNDTAPPASGEPVQLRCVSSADRAEPKGFDQQTIRRMKQEAMQIAVLLPSSRDEARAVMGFVADLLDFVCK
jgi:hypothetical protein